MPRLYRPLTRKLLSMRHVYRGRRFRRNAAPKGMPKTYTVAGTPVVLAIRAGEHGHVGLKIDGKIERQVFGGVRALFMVKFKHRTSTVRIAEAQGRYTPSEFTKMRDELKKVGCLVTDGGGMSAATCMWARWGDLTIPAARLKKGMPLEVVSTQEVDYPVRYIKRDKQGNYIFWLPEPMTWYDVEKLYDWTKVRPEYISKHAYSMPFEAYKTLYRAGFKMPKARRRRLAGRVIMDFLEPVPIKEMVDKYLRPYYHTLKKKDPSRQAKDIWGTILRMVLFHMIPVHKSKIAAIRPMREDLFYGLVVPAEEATEGL
jgi:hypothetical protein